MNDYDLRWPVSPGARTVRLRLLYTDSTGTPSTVLRDVAVSPNAPFDLRIPLADAVLGRRFAVVPLSADGVAGPLSTVRTVTEAVLTRQPCGTPADPTDPTDPDTPPEGFAWLELGDGTLVSLGNGDLIAVSLS